MPTSLHISQLYKFRHQRPNMTYFRSDGGTPLFTTNAGGVALASLVNFGGTSNEVLTGLNTNWTISANTCTNWTSNLTGDSASVGDSTGVANFLRRYMQTYDRPNGALYCVEL